MASDDNTHNGMAGRARFVYGPRALGSVLPAVTRQGFRRRNPAAAQVVVDWDIIVGPRDASRTMPLRLSGGVLTIACTGPVAMELQYRRSEIISRINTHLGGQPVRDLKFTQAGTPRKSPPAAVPPPEANHEAEAAVAGLPDGDLKSALTALGRVVIGRSQQSARRLKKS